MKNSQLPLTKDLVLIGGGHAHALVLKKWGMSPLPGARLTVINPGPTAPYSGMLPGFVAGHYQRSDLDIDLVKLARFAGARVVLGAADGIDTAARMIRVPGRAPIAYDVASVDIGITSEMPNLPGFAAHAVPAKPLGAFAAKWDTFRAGLVPAHIAVIGGGVAGVELVLAMAYALKSQGRLAQATLIDSAEALTAIGATARNKLRTALTELGVTLLEGVGVESIQPDHIRLQDGREVLSDFTTGAAGARPYGWISETGLALNEGFISVDANLKSSDPALFATGDCAHLTHAPRPKAGVYAVRQAPVLFDNLRAVLSGGKLRPYQPQKDYLKLISLGQKSALAERLGRTLSGPMMWRWKNRIDQKFMAKFRDYPVLEQPTLPPLHTLGMSEAIGDKPMCGGCGAKVGRNALRAALAPLPSPERNDITPLPGDDAALLMTGGVQQVISSDHLRSLTDDVVVMARIAAVHALGDIWAMGAQPQAATANLILPRMSSELQERTLREIMATASQLMRAAGAEIVGGHTSLGDELTIGFTVTGLCHRPAITLAGALPGDVLILTKPIGSGVIMAAEMAGQANGEWVSAALAQMSRPQARASEILNCAHAMTDVTGFGLYGHLSGICEASGLGARLNTGAVPLMQGAAQLADLGIRSSLFADNRALAPDLQTSSAQDLLFDPQTSGGLLAAVSANDAETLLKELQHAGESAAVIGTMTSGHYRIELI
ncbi:selenide, water dikinase SelD [Parasedimentitalea huanghaiensis]|uniref:Selenide, water dikinase SelD n=1 Tax=Parasedimentitalea huanghaiensis TaxID=2682100 RepID=A0A6L6WJX7_9RHOB|nr:selenide, water dikinase SelD [Zongyanglinia huanghaiensis]MVO17478.1 selenide, water dikinase SelD [Zongyanglinia huanghaiensis]